MRQTEKIAKGPKALKKLIYENGFMEPFRELIGTMDGNSLVLLSTKIYKYILELNLTSEEERLEAVKNILYVQKHGYKFNKIVRQIEKNITYEQMMAQRFERMEEIIPPKEQLLYYRWCIGAAKKFKDVTGKDWDESILERNPVYTFKRIEDAIENFEKSKEKFKNAVIKYAYMTDSFEFCGTKFFATVPQDNNELYQEGIDMHNCLVMRGPAVANGLMKVVFLRKEDNKPYIDIILDENNKIIWAIRDYHKTVCNEDLEAVFLWYKRNVSNEVTSTAGIWR